MKAERLFTVTTFLVVATICCSCASRAPVNDAKAPSWRTVQPPPKVAPSSDIPTASGVKPGQVTEYFGGKPDNPTLSGIQSKQGVGGKRFELNLQDAEVRSVVDAVMGDVLKANYTVAPQIQGRLTLRTGRPVAKEALLSILETALLSVSAALIEQDGTYHIIPIEEAPQRIRGARRLDDSRRLMPGYAIEVLPLRYVSAREMQKILDSFAPKGSVLQADDAHNHLVLAGTSQERSSMIRTIDAFDVDWMSGTLFAIYHLDQVGPEQLIAELRQVFQPPLELTSSRIRLLPLERMQSILGVAKNKVDLELIEEWIRRLDVAPKSGGRRLYVYNVQNGSAKELAASLQLVMTGEVSAARVRPKPPTSEPVSGGGGMVPPAGSNVANDLAVSAQGNISRVVANEENNSLLILGTEQEYRLIRDALSKLDVMPRQVMIEAILAEVTLNDNLRYGVQWFFNSGTSSSTFSSNEVGAVGSLFPGFSYVYSGLADARVVINALQSKTDVKVISAPKLAVLNNQKASLQVGDEVPIRTQISQGVVGAGAPIIASIQMRETGVLLDVTPRVNDNGNVILEVTQEVSEVAATTSSGIDSPTIQRRRLHSVVATRDGATVAMGGLIRESNLVSNSGIPLLKDIPLLGNLFRTNTSEIRRTELVVLLIPRVMRNHEETEMVVDQFIGSMNAASEFASRVANIVPKTAP